MTASLIRSDRSPRPAVQRDLRVDEAAEAYLRHLKGRGRSPATIRVAEMMLRSFRRWTGDNSPIAEFDLGDIELGFLPAWEDEFEKRNGRRPSASSARNMRQALRGLFAFLDRLGLLRDPDGNALPNPLVQLDVPPAPYPRCDHLVSADAERLLLTARTARQKIVIALLLGTGVRAGEAVRLTDDDVDVDRREIRIRTSKTPRGRRTIPFMPWLEEPIREWRQYRDREPLSGHGSPFLSTRGGRAMTTRSVWKVVRSVAENAGVRTVRNAVVTPHTLRRTYATNLLNRGVRLETVSRLLGHAGTTITEQAYAQLSDERIRKEVETALAPIAVRKTGLMTIDISTSAGAASGTHTLGLAHGISTARRVIRAQQSTALGTSIS